MNETLQIPLLKTVLLTPVLYGLTELHTHGVDDTGSGGAVHTSAQRQQETSLRHVRGQW